MVFIAGSYVKELFYIGATILSGFAIFVYFNPARWNRVSNNDGSTKVGFRYRECARQTNNK
jgi:hypothetical protein